LQRLAQSRQFIGRHGAIDDWWIAAESRPELCGIEHLLQVLHHIRLMRYGNGEGCNIDHGDADFRMEQDTAYGNRWRA
jgi:hypothetical protein